MTRSKILFVTSRFPFPVIGGDRLRVFNLLLQIQVDHDVTLLSLGQPTAEEVAGLKRSTRINDIRTVPHGRMSALWGSARALLNRLPLQVGYYRSSQLEAEVAHLSQTHDLAIFHLIRTSAAWRQSAPIPVVLDMCDALSANFAQTAREGAWWSPWRLISAIEAPRTARFERCEARRFDLVSLVTQRDALIVNVPEQRLLVATQGVNLKDLPFTPPSRRSGRAIVLIGKMDFFPNHHGAEWFASKVLPLLPHNITFKVVGECPDVVRNRLMAYPRVAVTGRVDSLSHACEDAFAAIAPMHVATGIQNKVLEYFAMGLPTITTPSVASGLLSCAQGGHLCATTPEEWAAAVMQIIEQPEVAEAMAEHARDYATREHHWDTIGGAFRRRLSNLLNAT